MQGMILTSCRLASSEIERIREMGLLAGDDLDAGWREGEGEKRDGVSDSPRAEMAGW